MNINKRILIASIAINLLVSCKKTVKEASEELTTIINNYSTLTEAGEDPYNNHVAITCSQLANWEDTANSYDITTSAIFSDNGVPVNIGPIVVNGRTIVAGGNNIYAYNYGDNNTLAEGKSLLGSTVQVSGTGSGAQRISGSATIVVPVAIFPTTYYYPKSVIDKAVALPLIWAPDPNNQFQKVNIEISYYKGISQANAPNMPNSLTHLFYQVADNGSFTVPQADLEALPKGCFVGISIARASLVSSSGNVTYIAVTEGHSSPILVTDSRNPIYSDVWSSTSTANVGSYGYYSGDVNGDGNTDIIQPWSNGGTLALIAHDISGASTNVICNNTMTGAGITNIALTAGDFDGDGKCDFIQGWKNGNFLALSVFKSNGTSFSTLGSWTTSASYNTLKLLSVDMDGDGKSDIVQLWNNNGKMGLSVFKSTGSGYTLAFSTTFNNIGSGNIAIFPSDYDGDGKTDIVQLWNNNGSLGVIVYRSTGSSYVNTVNTTMQAGAGNVGFAPVDYNADGKMDFIQGWSNNNKMSILLYKSNGTSFTNINNSTTQQGTANLGLLPVRRFGDNKTGFVQVYNSNSKTAFIRYWPY